MIYEIITGLSLSINIYYILYRIKEVEKFHIYLIQLDEKFSIMQMDLEYDRCLKEGDYFNKSNMDELKLRTSILDFIIKVFSFKALTVENWLKPQTIKALKQNNLLPS